MTNEGRTRAARVLAVDDERHIARLIEFVLKKEGYDVRIAHDGENALSLIEEFSPDAVLLDLMLPRMSGLDVLKALRSDGKHTNLAVMVLTARSFEEMPAEVIDAGASMHCTKPIAPSSLVKKLLDLKVPPRIAEAA